MSMFHISQTLLVSAVPYSSAGRPEKPLCKAECMKALWKSNKMGEISTVAAPSWSWYLPSDCPGDLTHESWWFAALLVLLLLSEVNCWPHLKKDSSFILERTEIILHLLQNGWLAYCPPSDFGNFSWWHHCRASTCVEAGKVERPPLSQECHTPTQVMQDDMECLTTGYWTIGILQYSQHVLKAALILAVYI